MLRSVRIRFALWCAMLMGIMPLPLFAGWSRTYPVGGSEVGRGVIPLKDNSYMVLGASEGESFRLLKLNEDGDTLWTKSHIGNGYSMDMTLDGNFVITGSRNDSMLIMKVGPLGEVVWSRTYRVLDKSLKDFGNGICSTADGGYVLTGAAGLEMLSYPGFLNYRFFLLKVDAVGEREWSLVWRDYQTDDDVCDWGECVRETPDGGYIALGTCDAWQGFNGAKACCARTDSSGEVLWNKTYEGGYALYGNSICAAHDGGYIFTGRLVGDLLDDSLYITRIDSLGLLKWKKTFTFSEGYWIEPTNDGNYIIAGYRSIDRTSDWDLWLLKIKGDGDTLWTRSYGGQGEDAGYCVKETPDGGFIITGEMQSALWVLKTNYLGQVVGITEPPVVQPPPTDFEIASPIGSKITLRYSNCPEGFSASVFDVTGSKVDEIKSAAASGTIEWGDRLGPGVYFIKMNPDQHPRKVVLVK